MRKLIILNYETGQFFEEYAEEAAMEIVSTLLQEGADLENIRVYEAREREILEEKVISFRYRIGPWKSNLP